ncbi:MAG TPA: hypothetical protein VNB06_07735 [Thermoanaerobaculia bacterium]|nr:hypothetical protein [Thermoanaerobaculia bacterium]
MSDPASRSAYESLDASELFCPRCRRSQPVRRHLLLVLPTGNRYEYRCAACGESVGAKSDDDPSAFESALRLR